MSKRRLLTNNAEVETADAFWWARVRNPHQTKTVIAVGEEWNGCQNHCFAIASGRCAEPVSGPKFLAAGVAQGGAVTVVIVVKQCEGELQKGSVSGYRDLRNVTRASRKAGYQVER